MKRIAVFLDRDGTIIKDVGYLYEPEKIVLMTKSVQALLILQKKGFCLVIISNQSGVGRGFFSKDDLANVHNRLLKLLEQQKIVINGSYYCLHAPWENCQCRKPHPGMLIKAAGELNIDLFNSYMVGDKLSDVSAGLNAGCRSILIEEGRKEAVIRSKEKTYFTFPDLLSASQWITEKDTG